MKLIEDVANKEAKHILKNEYWTDHGVEVLRRPLPVGDYILVTDKVEDVLKRKAARGIEPHKMDFLGTCKVAVDTKMDMTEIEGNIVGKAHERFRDECILAQNCGIKLYVLVENNEGIRCLEDVAKWQNPRLRRWMRLNALHKQGKALSYTIPSKPPVNGERLMKAMATMQEKYGVTFAFCTPLEAGQKVIDILERGALWNS